MRLRSYSRATLFASVALTAAHVAAFAQAARALAIEDFYKIPTVAAPSLSPDARWVSFTVSTKIEENNGTRPDVWLVPADGSSPARQVSGSVSATNPRWTDDGRLQFTSGT
ncbi:MAG TPA: hypothetical protein VKP00_09340, partial [Gemmatimonadaceae bacterium]|nr:hypothetical protein [Gemmatimonadaceae bacterium]